MNHRFNASLHLDCLQPNSGLQQAELSKIRHSAGLGQVRPPGLDMSVPACPGPAQLRQLSSWLTFLGGDLSLLLAWVALRSGCIGDSCTLTAEFQEG